MATITKEMVQCAYETDKRVWNGTLTHRQGIEEISQECGMNKTSASNMLHVIQCMLNGETYRRTINAYAIEYFLAKIGEDFGIDTQQKAARSAL